MDAGNSCFLGKKILIAGASSDIAIPLNKRLVQENAIVGLHYNSNYSSVNEYCGKENVLLLQKDLSSAENCFSLVDNYVKWAGGIDGLVLLLGSIRNPVHWEQLNEDDWLFDLNINLLAPFFVTQRAINTMKATGGHIVFTSTASAVHGGGSNSLAYGVTKAGVECMVKGLARDCAKYNILINAIAPGFIDTKFHTKKMKRTEKQMSERAKLVPLARAGTVEEVASVIMFLLSNYSSYITGHILTVSGGDWL